MSVELVPLAALQEAIFQRLTDATYGVETFFTNLDGRIYDDAPDSPEFPYIDLGIVTFDNDGSKSRNVSSFEHAIHVYSGAAGMKEANQIVDAIVRSLTTSEELLPIAAPFQIVKSMWVSGEAFKEREEQSEYIVRHAIIRFEFQVQNVTS